MGTKMRELLATIYREGYEDCQKERDCDLMNSRALESAQSKIDPAQKGTINKHRSMGCPFCNDNHEGLRCLRGSTVSLEALFDRIEQLESENADLREKVSALNQQN